MVDSFGDGGRRGGQVEDFEAPARPDTPPDAPPYTMPSIAIVLAPGLDVASLDEAMGQLRRAVADAVRAGFADALTGVDSVIDGIVDNAEAGGGAEHGSGPGGQAAETTSQLETTSVEPARRFDANPTVNSRDPYAYAKYAERLDREVPGWWRGDLRGVTPQLVDQAMARRERAHHGVSAAL